MVDDLFSTASVEDVLVRPLAVRMRPTTLDDVIGQDHVLGEGSPLRRVAQQLTGQVRTAPTSIILFGPPGVGKTTLAYIVAKQSGRAFEELSAVTSGVKDIRDVLTRARTRLVTTGQETVLFVDEVHRFSKSQQDALLPSVENRDITFIAATTENPSFSIISPLISRSVVVKLNSLTNENIQNVIRRAIHAKNGLNDDIRVTDDAIADIARLAGGDARKSLTILEAAAGSVAVERQRKKGERRPVVDASTVSSVLDVAQVNYDKSGDNHYDVASAFIKSMRGSDPDAAVHYLARMLQAGEDPRFIARRIMISAAEDVGMAAPQILPVTVAAAQAVALVGMPEARIILAEAVVAVATAPKSNASYNAINAALADVQAGNVGEVPLHLRNAPTKLMEEFGNHEGYIYAHDVPGAVATQEYLPEELRDRIYYQPTDRGYEREVGPRMERIRAILHAGRGENAPQNPPQPSQNGTQAQQESGE
ncbi:AAA family ATPase [Alloscardovia macacae]|uniref:AAA family ATPase n=1 Tax=Alloscardovia macacae TaxID=1160091 RepID=A0A1Y2T0Y3_9BIFI|nr:replication-associated recombination protein A [Alloscardovia macacae]OTA27623.1 AAA family ATPase [Alloscardovia macacae]OTA30269.1 AAA family ATPase [Alloscardovia macacae]